MNCVSVCSRLRMLRRLAGMLMLLVLSAAHNIVDVTDEWGPTELHNGTGMIVKFFTPSCRHCKTLAPTWELLSDHKRLPPSTISVGQVDCSKQRKLCAEMAISAYPTILLFAPETKQGTRKMYKYKGERKIETLTGFAQIGWKRCWHVDIEHCYQYFPALAKDQAHRRFGSWRIALAVGCVGFIVIAGLWMANGAEPKAPKEANKSD